MSLRDNRAVVHVPRLFGEDSSSQDSNGFLLLTRSPRCLRLPPDRIASSQEVPMSNIVKFETENGPVYVEVTTPRAQKSGVQKAGLKQDAKQVIQNATSTFEAALANAFVAANTLVDRAVSLKVQPQELNIEFGLKVSGEMDLFVISGDTEANFAIKIKWVRDGSKSSK